MLASRPRDERAQDADRAWLSTLGRERSTSDKSWTVAFLLSLFLGVFGADRFYVNQLWLGLLKLLSFAGFGFWWLIDVILLLTGGMKDAEGTLVRPPWNRKSDS